MCQADDYMIQNSVLTDHCDRSASHKENEPCNQCECCFYCQKFIKKESMEAHKPPCREEYSLDTILMYFRNEDVCNDEAHDNNCHGFGADYCMKCEDCDKCNKPIKRHLVERHATITCEKLPRDEVKKTIAERKAKLEREHANDHTEKKGT